MQLKIDLQELDDAIQRYEGLIKDFQDCQSQMEEIIMDLGSCWTGVHTVKTLVRLTALERGPGSSLDRIQEQTNGILQILEIAREGMNREKNRCDHFPDVVADAHASVDMQFPDVRKSGSDLLFIDYDRSAALVDLMDSILDNELSLEGRGSGQMGRWKVMFDGIDGQLRHTQLNLRAEDRSATKNLREQHQKLENFKQALTLYHMNLAELEKNVSDAFLGYDRYQQEMAERTIYRTAGPGQETLVMTELEFFGKETAGRILCDWESVTRVLQKSALSEQEQSELTEILDRIAKLPEQEKNAAAQLLMDGCKVQSGALGQFIEAYHSHLNTLTAEDRPSAERLYNQLLIRQYQLGNVDAAEFRNPVEGRYVDYISGKAEKWLTPGYKMTRLDIMETKRMMEGFWEEKFGQGVIDDNNRLVPDENLTKLRVRNRNQLEDLEHKMSPYSNFAISAINSVPLAGKVLDTLDKLRPKPPGSEYLESSRFSTMAANSRTQNPAMSYLGSFAGQLGTYYVANKAIQSIPKIGAAIGAASEKPGKLPILDQVDTRHIANVLSGLAADVTVDTVPNAVDDTMEGQSIKKIIANISLNVLGNVGYNIIGEGMGNWFDNFADGFKWEFDDEIIKGGSGAKIGDFTNLEGSTVDDILDRIPDEATLRELHPVQGGATDGFEFKWVQEGQTYRARVHSADPGSPAGSNASNGWVVRIQRGKQYYDPTINDFRSAKYTNPNGDFFDESIMNNTHIPIKDPYNP